MAQEARDLRQDAGSSKLEEGGIKQEARGLEKNKKADSNESAFVRVIGLEPTCLAAPDPKSGTSANFATPAFKSKA